MGLDRVELILSVEESFGIHIPDEDAQHLSTLRKLSEYVEQRLAARLDGCCLSQRAFYRVRQGLLAGGALIRGEIRPTTRLEHLLPPALRRDQWQALQQAVGLPFPALVHSPRQLLVGCFATGGVAVQLLWLLLSLSGIGMAEVGFGGGLFIATLLWSGLFIVFERLTRPQANHLQTETVGALATHLATHHARLLLAPEEHWTRAQIRETVAGLLYDVSGLEHADPDADFRRDLGID